MPTSPSGGGEQTAQPKRSPTFQRPPQATSAPSRSRTSTLSEAATGPPMLPAADDGDDTKTPTVSAAPERPTVSRTASVASEGFSQSPEVEAFSDKFVKLPIELVSLADRFISSLTTAKIYPTPPTAEKLSELFQDFYAQAESHILTHIQELQSRQFRDSSPAPSQPRSRSSTLRQGSTDTLGLERVSSQQMLTSKELYERRRARKLLEQKRAALEEAIERRVCEGIYDRIWRHRSTLDEMRDEKLRSRTAALAVMGVGLKELGLNLALTPQAEAWIAKARASLCKMDEERYPLGKLQYLAAAHQNIVELLASSHQGSSSADEILPTMIFTLIGSPVERMNLVSNLYFIQRFRTASKMNGESAYCLTNLEAAITFLETVDITTLSVEESEDGKKPQAPIKSPDATTPQVVPDNLTGSQHTSKPPPSLTIEVKPYPPASPLSARRPLSAFFQPPASAIGAASDAMRSTADEGLKNIGSALDKSFNFMFGRLREHSLSGATSAADGTIVAPKTLDDARRLISPKNTIFDEDGTLSEDASIASTEEVPAKEDRLLDMITGPRARRDRSSDSRDSTGSGQKRPGLAPDSRASTNTSNLGASPPISAAGAVESMRSIGNSLNALKGFTGMGMMKGFGRATPVSPIPGSAGGIEGSGMPPATPQGKFDPPLQQFLEITDPHQLRVGDVGLLLRDYQRLAEIVKSRGLL